MEERNENSDNRGKILQAALEEFSDKGKGGARMQAIADRAFVNKALLHYYFHSKDDLYRAVFTGFFQNVFRSIKNIRFEQENLEGTIRAGVNAYMGIIRQNPNFLRLMVRQMLEGESAEAFLDKMFGDTEFAELREILFDTFDRLKKAGVLKDVDPRAAVLILIGSMVIFFIGKPMIHFNWPEVKEDEDAFFESYKNTVVTMLLHGLLKEGRI